MKATEKKLKVLELIEIMELVGNIWKGAGKELVEATDKEGAEKGTETDSNIEVTGNPKVPF